MEQLLRTIIFTILIVGKSTHIVIHIAI